MIQLIVDKRQTLKKFTENNYAQGSFYWSYLLKNREIKVNGKRVGEDVLLMKGDAVCYYLTPKQENFSAYTTVYEDDNIIVTDKESGVNSEAVFADLQRRGEYYFIHRLDRNTKGLMVFARNAKMEKYLLDAFSNRQVEKKYHALCFGVLPKKSSILTAYLKKDAEKSVVEIFDRPKQGTEKIVTEYAVLSENCQDGCSKLEITLHTGKTHQIRAHLAHIGYPIVGDMKYGNSQKNKEKQLSRQCLIAKSLCFKFEGEFSYLSGKVFLSKFELEEDFSF